MTSERRTNAPTTPRRLLLRGSIALAATVAACGPVDVPDPDKPADTTAPTVVITDDISASTATGTVTFLFTFSEDVGTSFTAASVTPAGATSGTVTHLTATTASLQVTPPADATGTIEVSVAVGAFSDIAGNKNTVAATATQPFDTKLLQMSLPVSFDAAGVAYGLLGFGGAEDSTVVADPAGGENKVVKVVKSATAETWAGTTFTSDGTLGFSTKVPFTTTATRMTLRVYAPAAGMTVRLKAEDHANNAVTVETEALTTGANAWETLTFDFADQAGGTPALNVASSYDKVSVFFNFGVAGATAGAKTFYCDDLVFIGGGGTLPAGGVFDGITFDSATIAYALKGFGGAEDSTVVIDPAGGTNKVAKVVKGATAESWAGTTVSIGPKESVPKIPVAVTDTRMTLRVYSPTVGIKVRMKIEDHADVTHSVETEATTTKADAWETLTFDFAHEAAGTAALNAGYTFDKVSVFFNFGVAGAATGAKTYYFDDMIFIGGTTPIVEPPAFATVTFDATTITYGLKGFGGAEDSTVAADPAGGSNKVGRAMKSATAELWAGTTVFTGANDSVPKLPFTATATRMSVRVYSPDSGIQVRLKVENQAAGGVFVETEATTTTSNAWETLTFDFAKEASGSAKLNVTSTYDRVSIFFNFGVTGATAGAKTYFFDDLAFIGGGGSGGGTVGTFETITFDSTTLTYTLTGFGGAENASVVVDPTGGSNKVVKVVKSATAELWAGTTVSTLEGQGLPKIPLAAGHTRMTVRVYSPDAGIKVRLKVEDKTNPTITVETEAPTTKVNAWETLTFDFANPAAGTASFNAANTYDKASVFFNFGVTGATAGEKTYHFDDLAFLP